MATIRLNISLEEGTARKLKQRAADCRLPVSRYLAVLIESDARRKTDALAAEGYRLLSEETVGFSEAGLSLVAESWPEWEGRKSDRKPKKR